VKQTFSFRIAKDGLPFDEEGIAGALADDEVEVIQFMRPDGSRKRMVAPVGKELAKKAKHLILSAEHLRTGQIAIYARRIGDSEEGERLELAENGPGKDSPTNVLKRLIEEKGK